ncbi:secreted Ly-6/uPAR domain-containing protein 2 [Erinaceus europaeus]|uniref:Secreted Ly-6/uPAR domain-containing protein 2 n=1 Tax=Erinaceus europaeus TaxID=9365 RepID=A0ABM3XSS9_ERIEU|nr:secreted Ly-6/uPAR domain-containing protein 2 [Erinaceus europaeus]
MRLFLGFLLAAALSLELVKALHCHGCKGFGGCVRHIRCPWNSDHCVTFATRSPFRDLPLVTKMCSVGCPDSIALHLGPHVSVSCCQASLCNQD